MENPKSEQGNRDERDKWEKSFHGFGDRREPCGGGSQQAYSLRRKWSNVASFSQEYTDLLGAGLRTGKSGPLRPNPGSLNFKHWQRSRLDFRNLGGHLASNLGENLGDVALGIFHHHRYARIAAFADIGL